MGYVFEYTWEGASWSYVEDYPKPDKMVRIKLPLEIPAILISERYNAFCYANRKMDWFDLFRIVNGLPPHGLVCTSFVLMLLGYDPEPCTVDELAFYAASIPLKGEICL